MSRIVLRLLGVQPDAFRVLVPAFWRLTMRSSTSLVMQRAGSAGNSLWKAWLLYGFFGALVAGLVLTGMPRTIFATIVSLSALFLIGMAVVADFAVFVMAPGDDEVLFHRPIRSRTYLAARLAVAGMHVGILALCYGLAPALASLKWGDALYPPLFLFALLGTALFALLLAFGVYRLGLRLLGGERLQGILTYLPAFFSILTFLVPQMLIGNLRGDAAERIEPFLTYLPPAWFVSVPEVLLGNHDPVVLLRAGLGLVVLPLGFWVLLVMLGRGFLRDLLGLLTTGGRSDARAVKRSRNVAGRGASRSPEERAGYLLYLGAMRSRDSRTRAAPALLMPIAFLVLGLVRPGRGAFNVTLATYMLAAGAGTLLGMAVFHEHHPASWLYGAVPVRRYGRFVIGAVRAMLVRHLLPVFVLLLVVSVIQRPGWITVAGTCHAFAGGCLSIPFLAGRLKDPLFSRAFQASEQTAQMGLYFLSMLLVGLVGALHALVETQWPWAFAVTVPGLAVLVFVWLREVAGGLDLEPPAPIALRAGRRRVPAAE